MHEEKLLTLRRSADSILNRILRNAPFARIPGAYPSINDLGVIGDRHTAAVVTKSGDIVWYCPARFDAPSLFGALLDHAIGGSWTIHLPRALPEHRRYVDDSAVIETILRHPAGGLTITDWMTLPHNDVPRGILCRKFSAAPAPFTLLITPRPDYGRRVPEIRRATPTRAVIDERFHLQSSHPVTLNGAALEIRVARGQPAWAVLSDAAASNVLATEDRLHQWLAATLGAWQQLAQRSPYQGAYSEQVHASLRALRLLVFEETSGSAAAVTTSLPEVIGGKRNFDYRYSWLRDSGIGIRALTRFEPEGAEARRYLGFVANLCNTGYRKPLDPVSAVGGERVPEQTRLNFAGYRGSRPTLAGNRAARQLQLGSLASFLLAAREVYELHEPRLHWEAVREVADFLVANWRRADNGIWEQKRPRQFTTSKVFTACALEGMAQFAGDPARAERYRTAAQEIRGFVSRSCRTRQGGYAAIAGTEAVDISAALYPVFGYTSADDDAMDTTIRELERRREVGEDLYHRHLESARAARKEGAFLAGTFWIAHYWITRGDLERGSRIIESGLTYANDLGLFSEEINARSRMKLGNFPLGLVHASFLAAVADCHAALSN